MHTFRDSAGRTWTVAINVATVKRVRARAGVDLYALAGKPDALGEFLSDPVAICDTLYVLCQDEAERAGVTDEAFGQALYGDAIHAATEALLEDLCDFFPNPAQRGTLRKLIVQARKVEGLLIERAAKTLEGIDPAAVAEQIAAGNRGGNGSAKSTSSPAASAATRPG